MRLNCQNWSILTFDVRRPFFVHIFSHSYSYRWLYCALNRCMKELRSLFEKTIHSFDVFRWRFALTNNPKQKLSSIAVVLILILMFEMHSRWIEGRSSNVRCMRRTRKSKLNTWKLPNQCMACHAPNCCLSRYRLNWIFDSNAIDISRLLQNWYSIVAVAVANQWIIAGKLHLSRYHNKSVPKLYAMHDINSKYQIPLWKNETENEFQFHTNIGVCRLGATTIYLLIYLSRSITWYVIL